MKGLVLAGGGARGSYQVGVWQALAQVGWKPDIITGTSVGSLNGAMLAAGQPEKLEQLWLTLTQENVARYPEPEGSLRSFLEDMVQSGGLDVTPLQEQIDLVLSEEAVRLSPVRFGLVTVEMKGLKPHELTIDEIPQGKLRDYLLASSACFPAFRPREIDGVKYIDGGYTDNMPFGLAARMGATELICVDLNGLGINRWNTTGLPTTVIESAWSLGGLLAFSPENARRNIALGRLDALRILGYYQGQWYAVTQDEEFLADLGDAVSVAVTQAAGRLAGEGIGELVGSAADLSQALELSERLALPLLEREAREQELDPTRVYSPRELAALLLEGQDREAAQMGQKLFSQEGSIHRREAAQWMLKLKKLRRAVLCKAIEWTLNG